MSIKLFSEYTPAEIKSECREIKKALKEQNIVFMTNPKKPKPKKVQEVTLQIITHSQAKVKKHLKPEDTTEMFSKHKKN